jgi:tetratricopeptide (TPR) repeat protein
MMKSILTYLLLLVGLTSIASEGSTNLDDANTAYEAKNYKLAIETYEALIAEGNVSADIYYNYGNAQYRSGDLGLSIWGYESALQLDPDHEDALFNLEFVNAQTTDHISTSRQGIRHWLGSMFFTESINFWAYFSIGCSVLLSLTIFLFLRSQRGRKRSLLLLASAGLSLFLIGGIIIGYSHHNRIHNQDQAIVISDLVDVKMSPMDDAKPSFSLGAGAKVDLLSSQDKATAGWVEIEMNGNQGWVEIGSVKAF